MTTTQESPISPQLLEILRCPVAVQSDQYGDDPGQLDLVHNCWLVCTDTGLKYPIRDGIPVMLVEEGEKWKDTPVEKLPVPPPTA
ncbi:MAG: Trm112 family protein [Chloroflexi bacterium]|nr:Trm112 family protein [Chloroflexota bacterium]